MANLWEVLHKIHKLFLKKNDGPLAWPIDLKMEVECFHTTLHVFFQTVSRFDTYPLYIDHSPSNIPENTRGCAAVVTRRKIERKLFTTPITRQLLIDNITMIKMHISGCLFTCLAWPYFSTCRGCSGWWSREVSWSSLGKAPQAGGRMLRYGKVK